MSTQEAVSHVRRSGGWTRLDRLSLIQVSGPGRVKFLHGLLSNDIAGLAPGQSRLAALMNLKGQQIAWLRVLAEAEALICELPIAVRDSVIEAFNHYKVGAPVRFEKPDAMIFGVFGPDAAAVVEALGIPRTRAGRGQDLPANGVTLHADPSAKALVEEALHSRLGEPVTKTVLDTLRVEEGIPWHGVDVTEEHLLHETGQLSIYHSSSKGCYLGQEVVARLEGRGGHVNKHLRGLKCSQPAAAGDDISVDGKSIGRVTSAGLSPEFGAVAMGFVHRTQAEPGTPVHVAGAAAEVAALPFRS